MKNINLYLDFEMTSLSRDGQPISLGIVSDEIIDKFAEFKTTDDCGLFSGGLQCLNEGDIVEIDYIDETGLYTKCGKHAQNYKKAFEVISHTKSFYAEFTDFDIDRCDDWVKENVIKKLNYNRDTHGGGNDDNGLMFMHDTFTEIKLALKSWLDKNFKDYQITFVGDCVTWDWLHMLDLIAEWNYVCSKAKYKCHSCSYKNGDKNCINYPLSLKAGLPKLPNNITPVPQDLNDLISLKKSISIKEAFDLSREELIPKENNLKVTSSKVSYKDNVHNALWDAKIIKEIYNNLKKQFV